MAERKSLSKKTRFDVFKRDGFKCQYCGAHPPEVTLEIDHIRPVALGGENEIDNLVAACFDCNRGKGAGDLNAVPQSLAEKAAMVAEQEAQLEGYQEILRAKRNRIESDCWDVADKFIEHFSCDGIKKTDFASIKRFIEKMGAADVVDAMEIAIAAKPYSEYTCFKYFCGVCWNRIKAAADGQV